MFRAGVSTRSERGKQVQEPGVVRPQARARAGARPGAATNWSGAEATSRVAQNRSSRLLSRAQNHLAVTGRAQLITQKE
jgi:hypothetical protein